jgi:hypothetical protein
MDFSSPFVVVPVIVAAFFTCILWATRGSAESHQPHETESHPAKGHQH